MHIIKFLC